jgi:hypothetical protein
VSGIFERVVLFLRQDSHSLSVDNGGSAPHVIQKAPPDIRLPVLSAYPVPLEGFREDMRSLLSILSCFLYDPTLEVDEY